MKLGALAVDGPKFEAHGSQHQEMSDGRMEEETKLRREIQKLLAAAKKQDSLDDRAFGPDFRGEEGAADRPNEEAHRRAAPFGWIESVLGFRGFEARPHEAERRVAARPFSDEPQATRRARGSGDWSPKGHSRSASRRRVGLLAMP